MARLLSINNYYYLRGGAETIFFEHNRMLQGLGWDVIPFAMRHPRNLATPWSRYFVDEIELGADYSFAQKLIRVPKAIYSLEARRRLGEVLEQVRPDIAHGHNIYHHISPSILSLLKTRGVPTVLTLHDLKIACPSYNMLAPDGICERCKGGRLYNVVRHRCVAGSAAISLVVMIEAVVHKLLGTYSQCVDCFIVPSRFYIQKFAEWGMPASLFRHVPNFVDARRFEPRYSPGRGFLYFGRLNRQKGLATLIRAATLAGQPLMIAGTGPELEALQKLTAELSADVKFLGHLSGHELHEAIRSCRAVVLPSEWYENAPVSVLEAYALGRPVIGARIGGIPELIRENETGLSFASGDVASLVAAMQSIAAAPDARLAEIGRAARLWVEQEFTAAKYREHVLSIYAELGVEASQPQTLALPADVS